MKRPTRVAVTILAAAVPLAASTGRSAVERQAAGGLPPEAAFVVKDLADGRRVRESGHDLLDTPVLPGSVMKVITLVAGLERGAIDASASHPCRRVVTIDGRRVACAHADLKRPLTPAEALAHSCNDFFASLAPRLTRAMIDETRVAAGLPPLPAAVRLASAAVGLDGPRVTPRALIDVLARLVGVDPQRTVRMRASTRRVLMDGLAGAAAYGSASALGRAGVGALAKTGTAAMPGGGHLGLLVALVPADRPTRGIVVVAPGGAGRDAAAIAADLLQAAGPVRRRSDTIASAPVAGGGDIRLGVTANGAVTIDTLPLDEYVARIVSGEGQPGAGAAAQRALAVAARTFALANRNRHRREGYDLCDTTHCQVPARATDAARRAAAATTARVLLHEGQPAFVFYSAWCGGRPERASAVWTGAVDYGDRHPATDEACRGEPAWRSDVTARDLERALRTAGLRGSRLRGLRVVRRSASGRAVRMRVEGFVPADVDGIEFRMAVGRVLGWHVLKSTAFNVTSTGTGYRFEGRGFGHGVGLCVVGAGRRAASGASADDILRFYYPGLTVGPVPASAVARATAAPVAGAAPMPADTDRTADVRLALPAAEQSERDVILVTVRRARDDIAARAGVRPPVAIRVTVHPNVESFGRATGEPWWASGASTGTTIDLLPVALLRRQGQLERTIRHELAHVITDGALADRAAWVKEGAALYFADPDRPTSMISALQCPSDAELLRPVSAGAQREAYARAEACFRREIARGRSWQDIR